MNKLRTDKRSTRNHTLWDTDWEALQHTMALLCQMTSLV